MFHWTFPMFHPLERKKQLRLEKVSICYLCSEEQCDVEKVINPEGMFPQDIAPFFFFFGSFHGLFQFSSGNCSQA